MSESAPAGEKVESFIRFKQINKQLLIIINRT